MQSPDISARACFPSYQRRWSLEQQQFSALDVGAGSQAVEIHSARQSAGVKFHFMISRPFLLMDKCRYLLAESVEDC